MGWLGVNSDISIDCWEGWFNEAIQMRFFKVFKCNMTDSDQFSVAIYMQHLYIGTKRVKGEKNSIPRTPHFKVNAKHKQRVKKII